MKSKALVTLFSLFSIVFAVAANASAQGWKATEIDAGVDLAADFAVKEQASRAKTTITLNRVLKASDKQPKLGARDFMLCLDTNVKNVQTFVQAIVTVDQYSNHKLMGWSKSTCGKDVSGGGAAVGDAYTTLEKGHAGAGLAADFAVGERAKQLKSTGKLVRIVKAEMAEGKLLGTGTFRLCLVTTGLSVGPGSQALVSMDKYNNLKLVSWNDSDCNETDGEFELVERSHAGVGLAADFAVGKHSQEKKIEHKLVEILKGEIKGMFSPTYRVCMKVSEKGKTEVIQAVVSMDQYSNMKLLSWEHAECGK
jgi:hypothetical protein